MLNWICVFIRVVFESQQNQICKKWIDEILLSGETKLSLRSIRESCRLPTSITSWTKSSAGETSGPIGRHVMRSWTAKIWTGHATLVAHLELALSRAQCSMVCTICKQLNFNTCLFLFSGENSCGYYRNTLPMDFHCLSSYSHLTPRLIDVCKETTLTKL